MRLAYLRNTVVALVPAPIPLSAAILSLDLPENNWLITLFLTWFSIAAGIYFALHPSLANPFVVVHIWFQTNLWLEKRSRYCNRCRLRGRRLVSYFCKGSMIKLVSTVVIFCVPNNLILCEWHEQQLMCLSDSWISLAEVRNRLKLMRSEHTDRAWIRRSSCTVWFSCS